MKRWTRTVCAVGLLGTLTLGVGSCADNENMLVVVGVMKPSPPDCVYNPSGSSVLLLNGIMDAAFGGHYNAVLLVSNQLMAQGSKARLRAESSDVVIDNAEVTLWQNGKNKLGDSYSVPASGLVRAGSGQDVQYGAIGVQIIPGMTIPQQTGYIIAEVRLQGTTSGGRDIESNLLRFEIEVVDSSTGGVGLIDYNATDPDTRKPMCQATDCTDSAAVTYCNLGQDAPVSCCACLSNPVCSGPT
jgi:hypothetical protein